jgi:hypothetical protein
MRKSDYRMRGEAMNLEEFLLKIGGHVVALTLRELDDQAAGDFRRPFNAFADQAHDDGAKIILSIKGASPGEKEYDERLIDPDAYHERTRATLEDFLCERIAAISVSTVAEMEEQNETLDVAAFAFGLHVRLTDSGHLLHLRLECLPPAPALAASLEGFTVNNARES